MLSDQKKCFTIFILQDLFKKKKHGMQRTHIEDFQNEKGWEGLKNRKFRRSDGEFKTKVQQTQSKRVFLFQIH